jgi:outer membrane protein assembly factor BamA
VHNISKEEIKQKAAENNKKKAKESLQHEVSLDAAGEPLSQQTVEREREREREMKLTLVAAWMEEESVCTV